MIDNQHPVWDLLSAEHLISVATVDKHGNVFNAIVLYVYDSDGNFYFATSPTTAKAQNIEKNGKVSFTLVNREHTATLQGSGKAEILDPSEKEYYFNLLTEKAQNEVGNWLPILKFNIDESVIVKIHPTWLRLLTLRFDEQTGSPELHAEQLI